jgi:GT2 family glycosyltransferase
MQNSRRVNGPVVVAIPVRNEEARIAPCLAALVGQAGVQADHIVLLVNNTTDETVRAARTVPIPAETSLHIVQRTLAPRHANAGHARRLAMKSAARLAGPRGILLTTDADGRADPDWLEANLQAIADGADAVAGWVDLDPAEWSDIPMSLHEADARECAYDAVCDEIDARLDPDAADPWPRHTQASGASIAVRAAAFHGVGGIPDVPHAEDRGFIAALRLADARIRHAPGCHVVVSGRIHGRAAGGMADTIRRRMTAPDIYLDARLEPAEICARRAALRREARACYRGQGALKVLAEQLAMQVPDVRHHLFARTFGAGWHALEGASGALQRSPVRVDELPRHMADAERICAALRVETLTATPVCA